MHYRTGTGTCFEYSSYSRTGTGTCLEYFSHSQTGTGTCFGLFSYSQTGTGTSYLYIFQFKGLIVLEMIMCLLQY